MLCHTVYSVSYIPGSADSNCSWCISTDFTSADICAGENTTVIPGLMIPVSTRPTGTVPIPPILYTSCNGRRNAKSVGRLGGTIESNASNRIGPIANNDKMDRQYMLVQCINNSQIEYSTIHNTSNICYTRCPCCIVSKYTYYTV